MLGALPIATECWYPKKIEENDGEVDQVLEKEEKVGVVGRGVYELHLQGV